MDLAITLRSIFWERKIKVNKVPFLLNISMNTLFWFYVNSMSDKYIKYLVSFLLMAFGDCGMYSKFGFYILQFIF